MELKSRILDLLNLQQKKQPETLQKAQSFIPSVLPEDNILQRALMQFYMQNQVVYYPNNNNTFVNRGYKYNPHVYTIISWICRNLSQVEFEPYKIVDKKAHKNYLRLKNLGEYQEARIFLKKSLEEVESGGLYDVLKKPNPNQSQSEFLFEEFGYKELTGNAFTYGISPEGYSDNLFTELYNAPSPLMQIISGGYMQPVKSYALNYTFDKSLQIAAEKILHQKNWNPITEINSSSMLYGMSPLEPLLRTVKRSNESVDGSLALLVNGSPPGVLSNDSDYSLNAEERKAAQELFDQRYGGGRNMNKIIQATSKVSWQQIGLSSVDLELLASDQIDQDTIAKAYGIDPIIFNPGTATYNNKLTAEKSVWQNTLIPKLKSRRDSLNRWLTPAWSEKDGVNYYIDFNTDDIPCLQADLKVLSERMLSEFACGMWSPNDMLIAQGKEPDLTNEAMSKKYLDNKFHELGLPPVLPNFSNGGK
jgi:HK97 family phage portal protein